MTSINAEAKQISEPQDDNSLVVVVHYQKPFSNDNEHIQKNLKTCSICLTELSGIDLWNSNNGSCEHFFCNTCYKQYLETKMQDFQVINITCPQEGCKEILNDEYIKDILEEDRYNKYQELVLKKIANKDPNQKRFCPKAGCGRPIVATKSKDYLSCTCGTSICKTCFNFYHPGKSCLESLDPEFMLFAQENEIKFCLMCKTAVTRVEGCTHMTCCVCDYEWCWTCGRQYQPGHKCPKVWSPSPPSVYGGWLINLKFALKFVFLFILRLLLAPFCLVVFLVFWPAFTIRKIKRRISKRHILKSFAVIILSGVIGVLTVPVTIICLIFIFCKFLIKKHQRRHLHNKKPKRWIVGNPTAFSYTDVAKPYENPPRQVERNPPPRIYKIAPPINTEGMIEISSQEIVDKHGDDINNEQNMSIQKKKICY